jgi:hypothetical protein
MDAFSSAISCFGWADTGMGAELAVLNYLLTTIATFLYSFFVCDH